jgi:hypothetical protein
MEALHHAMEILQEIKIILSKFLRYLARFLIFDPGYQRAQTSTRDSMAMGRLVTVSKPFANLLGSSRTSQSHFQSGRWYRT